MRPVSHEIDCGPTRVMSMLPICKGQHPPWLYLHLIAAAMLLQFLTNFLMFPYMALRALPVDKPIEEQGPRPPEVCCLPPAQLLSSLRLLHSAPRRLIADRLRTPLLR